MGMKRAMCSLNLGNVTGPCVVRRPDRAHQPTWNPCCLSGPWRYGTATDAPRYIVPVPVHEAEGEEVLLRLVVGPLPSTGAEVTEDDVEDLERELGDRARHSSRRELAASGRSFAGLAGRVRVGRLS